MLTWAPPSSQSALMMKMKVGEDEDDGWNNMLIYKTEVGNMKC